MGRCWLMLLVIFLLGGCVPDEPVRPKAQREEEKETPDPVVEVEGIWAFAGVGADIEAPVGAENARYFIVGDAVAEIRFVRNDVAYSYKASKSEADLNAQQGGARACRRRWMTARSPYRKRTAASLPHGDGVQSHIA